MGEFGKVEGDGIGDIFSQLNQLLTPFDQGRRSKVEDFNPNENFTKSSIKFVHDLVYSTGPIKTGELLEIIKILFGSFRQDELKKHLGLLSAIKQIDKSDHGYVTSVYGKLFFDYFPDLHSLISAFRKMYLKSDPNRFKLC